MEQVSILGVQIDRLEENQVFEIAKAVIAEKRFHLLVTIDALGVLRAQSDNEYRKIVDSADLALADGAGIIWAAKFLHGKKMPRITGVDLTGKLCVLAAENNWKIFLLGAKPGVADGLSEKLTKMNPGIKIAGIQHGYFTCNDEVVKKINESKPDILFVALGMPAQEKWICRNREKLGPLLALGCGGSFDVLSGLKKRAPVWMRKSYLEWFFRMMQEPWRIKRIIKLPLFAILVLKEKMKWN